MTNSPTPQPAGILRRLGALFYDSLLVLALLFIAMAILTPFVDKAVIKAYQPLFFSYLLLVSFLFFGWFWTRGGQTLGMRAWKIRVETGNGDNISWKQSVIRFLVALLTLGIGMLWALFDREKLTLYDRLGQTRVTRVEKGFIPTSTQ